MCGDGGDGGGNVTCAANFESPGAKMTDRDPAADSAALADEIKRIIAAIKSEDMNTDKISDRAGMIIQTLGLSRTNTLAAVVYAAIHAPVVGVSKEQLLALVDSIFDATAAKESTKLVAEQYRLVNKEHHERESTAPIYMVPGNDRIH